MAFSMKLNGSSGVPYYRQIVDNVSFAVINGILHPGEQLPTVRQLAVDLQINLNTVIKAYKELEHKGVVVTQQGTGTFVSERNLTGAAAPDKRSLLRLRCLEFINETTSLGISGEELLAGVRHILKEREAKSHARKKPS